MVDIGDYKKAYNSLKELTHKWFYPKKVVDSSIVLPSLLFLPDMINLSGGLLIVTP